MSEANVGLVARTYDETRDYTAFYGPERTEAVFAGFRPLYHPTFEFQVIAEGNRRVRHGIHGYLALMRDWLAPWESYSVAADELRDLGGRVAVLTRHRGRLKDGGAEVRSEGLDIWTVGGALLLRLEMYLDRAPGLEAAGLR